MSGNRNGNLSDIPMPKRGINLWRKTDPAKIGSHSKGLQPHEIEWMRDMVAHYDRTGQGDRLIIYDNELSNSKSSEGSADFTLKRLLRPEEPGYRDRKAEQAQVDAAVATGSDTI